MTDQDHTDDIIDEDEAPNPRKRGLGRGLSALFDDEEDDMSGSDSQDSASGRKPTFLGIDQLEPGSYQPRRHMDEESIRELAESIATHGVLQPLLVRLKAGFFDHYEIIAGERRWRASQVAQLHQVPVVIREMDDETALEIGLIENLQREDLNVLEEAQGYQQLMEEFGHTQEKVAAALGKSRSHVANMVRLLALPNSVLSLIRDDKLSAGHARALIKAPNAEDLAKRIVNQGLSVRDAERLASEDKGTGSKKPSKNAATKPGKDVDTLALENEISSVLGMNVSIDMKSGGGGALRIDFKTLDQLDEVLHRLSHFPGRTQTG